MTGMSTRAALQIDDRQVRELAPRKNRSGGASSSKRGGKRDASVAGTRIYLSETAHAGSDRLVCDNYGPSGASWWIEILQLSSNVEGGAPHHECRQPPSRRRAKHSVLVPGCPQSHLHRR